ncbi:hypothetical protein AVEN_269649-1 [Araneus ventricosus]|uniref:Uncharacterized protein n=1 Tax=Araneus ventricosus TaxID=182803 RepID=A0A4Y2CSJ5_ARAVE|nr:hypothetical protein AVEN_269649-1 [Araneus ventricosus]
MSISSPACTADQTPTDPLDKLSVFYTFSERMMSHRLLLNVLDIFAPSRDRFRIPAFSGNFILLPRLGFICLASSKTPFLAIRLACQKNNLTVF